MHAHLDVVAPGYEELSRLLWRQRHLVEMLLCKLEIGRLLIVAEQTQWIDLVTREMAMVLDQIRNEELFRATSGAAHVAVAAGLPADATLSHIIAVAPPPWDEILPDHQRALLAIIDEVQTSAAANCELLERELRSTQEFLASMGDRATAERPSHTISRSASPAAPGPRPAVRGPDA
jgi:hypothetical protein